MTLISSPVLAVQPLSIITAGAAIPRFISIFTAAPVSAASTDKSNILPEPAHVLTNSIVFNDHVVVSVQTVAHSSTVTALQIE